MQEVGAGNPWALMFGRKQKHQLIKQRNLARLVELQAGRWFGGDSEGFLDQKKWFLGKRITSSCQKPWKPPGPPSSGNSREKTGGGMCVAGGSQVLRALVPWDPLQGHHCFPDRRLASFQGEASPDIQCAVPFPVVGGFI